MGTPVGLLRIEHLMEIPDLDLRIATEIDAAVGSRHRPVLEQQFDVAEFLDGRGVRPGAAVD